MSIQDASDTTVEITVEGSGPQGCLYFLTDEVYSRISKNKDEDDPVSLIVDTCDRSEILSWGIDASSNCSLRIRLNGKWSPLQIVKTDSGETVVPMEEGWRSMTPPYIEFKTDEKEYLGENVELESTKHVLVDVINWSYISLTVTLPVKSSAFDATKLSLLAKDMDSDTELAEIAYGNGLLDDLEEDLVGVVYDGVKYLFDCQSNQPSNQERWLISRSKNGWSINNKVNLIRYR